MYLTDVQYMYKLYLHIVLSYILTYISKFAARINSGACRQNADAARLLSTRWKNKNDEGKKEE